MRYAVKKVNPIKMNYTINKVFSGLSGAVWTLEEKVEYWHYTNNFSATEISPERISEMAT
jgi:hypothetical protein